MLLIKNAALACGVVAVCCISGLITFKAGLYVWNSVPKDATSTTVSDGSCNIAVLPMFGEIISYPGANKDGAHYNDDLPPTVNPDDVATFFNTAEKDGHILGVLAEIDSPGGSGSAGSIIASRIKQSSLPVAALVRESADSAAYMIASGADTIIASPFSDVGSIGITMSYLETSQQEKDAGIEFVSLASGKFKDAGNPDKPLTPEERTLFERDIAIWHDAFVSLVAENRNIPKDEVAKLADGSSMAASLALDHKLVDALGDQETAREWFSKKLNIPKEKVIFCK